MSYNSQNALVAVPPLARNGHVSVIGTSLGGNTNSFYECLCLISGGKLKRTFNGGLPGQNLSYIAERAWPNALNWNPGIVVLVPSYNGAGTFASDAIGVSRIIAEIRKSGALCVCVTEPTNGGTNTAMLNHNVWLKSYVASLNDPGCIISDLAAAIFQNNGTGDFIGHVQTTGTNGAASQGVSCPVTVANATGILPGYYCLTLGGWVQSVSGTTVNVVKSIGGISANASSVGMDFYQYMQDVTHPNTVGGMAIAAQMLNDMANAGFLNGLSPYTATDNNDLGNLVSNGTLEGTVTSGLSSFFTNSGFSAGYLTCVPVSNFRGNAQTITIPPGGAGGTLYGSSAGLRAYRGRKIAVSMKLSASGVQAGGAYYTVFAQFGVAPQSLPSTMYSQSQQPIYWQSADFEGLGMVLYGEAYVPDNATSLGFTVSITNGNSAANPNNLVLAVGELSVVDIDDPFRPSIRRQESVDSLSANTTIDTTYETVLVDCTSGAVTITLPAASVGIQGKKYVIKKIDSTANAVTIAGTVDGTTNPTLANQYASKTMQCDGTNWRLLNAYLT